MPRPRTWTDDQLVAAVAGASSWGAVVQALGLSRGSTGYQTVQGHVLRLGLDARHLPPMPGDVLAAMAGRVVGDDRFAGLAEAAAVSTSWAETFRVMGFPLTGSLQQAAKTYAAEHGIGTAHFLGAAWKGQALVPDQPLPFSRGPAASQLHRAGPAMATAWFLERGYAVSVPTEPAAYDLIAESDDGLKRIQVKTTTCKEDSGRYAVRIHRTSYGATWTPSGGRRSGRRPYRTDEIDFFFVITGGGAQYLLPVEVPNGCTQLVLDAKYAAYRVDQRHAGEAPAGERPACNREQVGSTPSAGSSSPT